MHCIFKWRCWADPRPKESLEGNEATLTWQVNYVGKSINLYKDAGYELSGSSFVINKLLGTTWLWDRVRVSGGAYGGFSDFDHHTGLLTFLSYRDPNLLKTVSYIIPRKIHLLSQIQCKLWGAELIY